MVMVRYIFIWEPVTDARGQVIDQWYRQYHGPEWLRYWGPYMTRYDTFKSYQPPPEALTRFAAYNHRVTDQWFISEAHWQEAMQGIGGQTLPPRYEWAGPNPDGPQIAVTVIPGRPTEDFVGKTLVHGTKNVVRWFYVFRYPDGITPDEGDKWFLNTHAPEVMKQPGLLRYFSYRTVDSYKPDRPNDKGRQRQWHRLVEQWYEDLGSWKKNVLESGIKYTPPPWAQTPELPFFKPYSNFISTFIGEVPDIDFIRDSRPRP
jgi:hypothetical protein